MLRILFSTLVLAAAFTYPVHAARHNRINTPVSNASRSRVANTIPTRARHATDLGEAAASRQLELITLIFNRTAEQQADLDQLLLDQQNPTSPLYHQWLTPQQFGERYGLASGDLAQISAWLTSQGFAIVDVAPSSTAISVSGTIGQAEEAFGVSIHDMSEDGEAHFANVNDPELPDAIASVVAGVRGLNDFKMKPHSILRPYLTSTTGNHFVAPMDFYNIYDVGPLTVTHNEGSGIAIAVVGQTDINPNDFRAFRSASGLTVNNNQLVIVQATGYKPGVVSPDIGEALLDVEWSGAIAYASTIKFVTVGASTSADVWDALTYAVTNNIAPIISISYGGCEAPPDVSGTAIQSWITAENQTLQQANAQGITIVAASGDSGATGCSHNPPATTGLVVNFPASSPSVTSVGGTMFNEGNSSYAYWSSINSYVYSAYGYIPETVWNETGCTDSTGKPLLCSGGGGASVVFSKPSWQVGLTPDDSARDVPDVSFNAAALHDPYLFCPQGWCSNNSFGNSTGYIATVGGTSAGAPVMAGVLALLEWHLGGDRLGNVNPAIYKMASSSSSSDAFHDITSGNNSSQCLAGSTDCLSGTGSIGYTATHGYDQATGWGSLDVFNFVNKWSSQTGGGTGGQDFNLSTSNSTASASASAGSSTTIPLNFTSTNGFSGTVTLSVSINTSGSGMSYSLSSTTVKLDGSSSPSVSLVLNAFQTSPATGTNFAANERHSPWMLAGSGASLACVLLLAVPRRRRWSALLALMISVAAASAYGCGGGSSGSSPGCVTNCGGGTTKTNAKPGAYMVTVTAKSGSLVQMLPITFTVK
ncbi:MAG: S53 family peptidase [Acidobacteriaceae bacterium]|nr:S53 family peptidase [Acidobacteriaceae bacterium]